MAFGGGGPPSAIYIVNGIFLALTWPMVIARCYVRHFLLRAFSKEDWLAVIALFGYTIMCAFNIMVGVNGSGSHMIDLTPQHQSNGLMWWIVLENFYIVTSVLVKASAVCVCLRLVDKWVYKIALHSCTVVMILYGIVFFCLNTFQCHPVDLFWKKYLGLPYIDKCMDESLVGNIQLVYASMNAAADIILSVVSCIIVYTLHLPTGGYRGSVVVVLSFGVLACCAVIIRLPFLFSLKTNLEDFLYYTTHVLNWSTIELGLGIMATAGASLRPLVRTIVSRSKFIGTSVDPTSTRWNRSRDHEGYIRSGAAPPKMGAHSRIISEDMEKMEMFPMAARGKAGTILDLDLKS